MAVGLGAIQGAIFGLFGIWLKFIVMQFNELRLNGGRMNTLVVEELFDFLGNFHVLGEIPAANVSGGDDTIPRKLPDMELVNCEDAINLGEQPLLDGVHLDMRGHRLQEN